MNFKSYLELIKFRYHVSFIAVILGALVFTDEITLSLIQSLLVLYFSFNILMYSGLYTMNDIADIKSDKKHPLKSKRPLPTKKISIKEASIFSFSFVLLGLVISYFYFDIIFYFFLAFILLNVIYSFAARNIPYAELIFNSATYPLRFAMGIAMVGSSMNYSLVASVFLVAFGISAMRRKFEKNAKGWQARKTIKFYSKNELNILVVIPFILILLLFVLDYPNYWFMYLFAVIAYILATAGAAYSKGINRYFKMLWLK
jgi:4-hydroxybenzoate polyprenyltransferase